METCIRSPFLVDIACWSRIVDRDTAIPVVSEMQVSSTPSVGFPTKQGNCADPETTHSCQTILWKSLYMPSLLVPEVADLCSLEQWSRLQRHRTFRDHTAWRQVTFGTTSFVPLAVQMPAKWSKRICSSARLHLVQLTNFIALSYHWETHQCLLQACVWCAFPQPLQPYWSQNSLDKSCDKMTHQ